MGYVEAGYLRYKKASKKKKNITEDSPPQADGSFH